MEGDGDTKELEFSGYLQKKNTKGLTYMQNRFFITEGSNLKYYNDQAAHERGEDASNVFDIRTVTGIERPGKRYIVLTFSNEKFTLELRAPSDEQVLVFTEIIKAKHNLYSVDELRSELDTGTQFRTTTFATLMVLSERDQCNWLIDRLDDIFDSADDKRTTIRRNSPLAIISAARIAIEDLLITCIECTKEVESRNPKIIVHCKQYMRRYADILKGRLVLELAFALNGGHRGLVEMGERALCAAIAMMDRVESLRQYTCLPKDFAHDLISSLFSVGECMSALLNLSIERIESWFHTCIVLPPQQRSQRLATVDHVLIDAIKQIDFGKERTHLQRDLLVKMTTNMLLNFSDQMMSLELTDYEESSLLDHINVCHEIADKLPHEYVINVFGDDEDDDEREAGDSKRQESSYVFEISNAVRESVVTASMASARTAVIQSVDNVGKTVADLVALLLKEGNTGWLGGTTCTAYVNRVDEWLRIFLQNLPNKYCPLAAEETGRLVVRLYLRNLVHHYQTDKRMRLSRRGVLQLDADLLLIYKWITKTIPEASALDEKNLVLAIRDWISCHEDNVLVGYAEAIQTFGSKYALPIYDLMRLVLKMRVNMPTKVRKGRLGMCAEFYKQLQVASVSDASLLSGSQDKAKQKVRRNISIFDELSPDAGVLHCTGSKWKFEELPAAAKNVNMLKLEVAELITDMCTAARAKKACEQLMNAPVESSNDFRPTSPNHAKDKEVSAHRLAHDTTDTVLSKSVDEIPMVHATAITAVQSAEIIASEVAEDIDDDHYHDDDDDDDDDDSEYGSDFESDNEDVGRKTNDEGDDDVRDIDTVQDNTGRDLDIAIKSAKRDYRRSLGSNPRLQNEDDDQDNFDGVKCVVSSASTSYGESSRSSRKDKYDNEKATHGTDANDVSDLTRELVALSSLDSSADVNISEGANIYKASKGGDSEPPEVTAVILDDSDAQKDSCISSTTCKAMSSEPAGGQDLSRSQSSNDPVIESECIHAAVRPTSVPPPKPQKPKKPPKPVSLQRQSQTGSTTAPCLDSKNPVADSDDDDDDDSGSGEACEMVERKSSTGSAQIPAPPPPPFPLAPAASLNDGIVIGSRPTDTNTASLPKYTSVDSHVDCGNPIGITDTKVPPPKPARPGSEKAVRSRSSSFAGEGGAKASKTSSSSGSSESLDGELKASNVKGGNEVGGIGSQASAEKASGETRATVEATKRPLSKPLSKPVSKPLSPPKPEKKAPLRQQSRVSFDSARTSETRASGGIDGDRIRHNQTGSSEQRSLPYASEYAAPSTSVSSSQAEDPFDCFQEPRVEPYRKPSYSSASVSEKGGDDELFNASRYARARSQSDAKKDAEASAKAGASGRRKFAGGAW